MSGHLRFNETFNNQCRTDLDDNDYTITSRHYGKSNVKIMHVERKGKMHTVKEMEVDTKLTLTTDKDYITGDNSDIIATDTQKNIVYVLAKQHGVKNPEEFALYVAEFFINQYSHVKAARVNIVEYPWQRITANGKPHNHAYIFLPSAERFTEVILPRNGKPIVTSGLRNLRVLKTTQSAFNHFHMDEFRTLPDSDDRVFSTIVSSSWKYSDVSNIDFDKAWETVKDCILEKFAGEPNVGLFSASVQNTLYETEKLALDRIPQIETITMDMPNKHYFAVDMSKFPPKWVGKEQNKTVFLPVDKPSGFIHATISRKQIKSKL